MVFFLPVLPAFAQSPPATPPDAGGVVRDVRPPPVTLPPPPNLKLDVEQPSPAARAGSEIKIPVRSLRIRGATAYPEAELRALLAEAIGRDLTLAELEEYAARVTRYYRANGYLVARAYVPAQEIRDGAVEIAVIEGRYGDIELRRETRLSGRVLSGFLAPLGKGSIVEQAPLERAALLVDDLPGVDARVTLRPGSEVGTTDLLVEARDARRVEGDVEFDNFGNRFTGRYRLGGNVSFNNPLGYGDQLSLRALASDENLLYGNLNYNAPLGYSGLRGGVAYTDTRYELAGDFARLDADGRARIAGVYLTYPFVRSAAFSLRGQLGYDGKKLTDHIGATGTTSEKHSRNAVATLSGEGFDHGGATSASVAVTQGRLNIDSDDARAIDALTTRSEGRFHKVNLNLIRLQPLIANTEIYFVYSEQFASKNLDSSEKLALGGAYGVRAYPQGEAPGDDGHILNIELRYLLPQVWFARPRLILFYDQGRSHPNHSSVTGNTGPEVRELEAAGIGFEWGRAGDFLFRIDQAWKLGSAAATADKDSNARLWARLVKFF